MLGRTVKVEAVTVEVGYAQEQIEEICNGIDVEQALLR